MNPLVRSELLKLKTIRSSYANGLAAIAFVPLTMAITVLTAGEPGGPPPLETEEGFRQVMAAASSGTIIAMILGILMVTGEFRHGTAIATFLVTPDRGRVTRAKLIVGAAVGVAIAVATSVATVAIALPWLTARDVAYDFVDGSIAMLFLGSILSTALYVLVGVGVGTLIRNQNAAQAVALVWTFVIETMIVGAAPSVGRWLPGGAAAAMTAAGANDGDLLPAWAGGLVLLAYGLALAAVGTIADRRRDVT